VCVYCIRIYLYVINVINMIFIPSWSPHRIRTRKWLKHSLMLRERRPRKSISILKVVTLAETVWWYVLHKYIHIYIYTVYIYICDCVCMYVCVVVPSNSKLATWTNSEILSIEKLVDIPASICSMSRCSQALATELTLMMLGCNLLSCRAWIIRWELPFKSKRIPYHKKHHLPPLAPSTT